MPDRDSLHRFLFEHYPIRGHLVHLDASWQALIEHREYPAAVRDTLGEAVAAALLLAATIKFDGVLTLQLQGDGPVHLLLVQCTSGLGVRGLARHRDAVVGAAPRGEVPRFAEVPLVELPSAAPTPLAQTTLAADTSLPADVARLIGNGNLTVTVESDDASQRYQGIVALSGGRVADSLQTYFDDSEQLPTRLWLQADAQGVSGMLLQRLPDAGGTARHGQPGAMGAAAVTDEAAAMDDAWRRVQLLAATLTPEELRTLGDAQILHRLFNEDDVRLYEPSPVYFRCRCSRERVGGMLQALGAAETRSVLAERGSVEVRCDFCNRAYVFDAVDVEQLFKAKPGVAGDAGGSVH